MEPNTNIQPEESPPPQIPTQSGSSLFSQPSNPRGKRIWITTLVVGVILLLGISFATMLGGDNTKKESAATDAESNVAATKLYDSLEKAAAKQTIRVAMHRTTYATNAGLDSAADPGFIQSSVAEIDAAAGKYSNVYAQKLYDKDTFSMQRCVNNTAYVDGQNGGGDPRPTPKNLTEANEYLKKMYIVTEALNFITCPNVGMFPGGSQMADIAPARLSDGLMPVTLQPAQAATWKQKLNAAKLFTVKDEGMTSRDGKQYHKYSFKPRGSADGLNKQLYDIFYESAEIAKLIQNQPQAKWMYAFIAINPINTGGIEGYYLIDEATGLPVSSELKGVKADKAADSPAAKANIGYNKQTYAYPTALTLDANSPLEILQ